MDLNLLLPKRKEIIRTLVIAASIFPLFILLRGKHHIRLVPFDRYLREFVFLLVTIGAGSKALQLFHNKISKSRFFQHRQQWLILTEILFIIVCTALIVFAWNLLLFPEHFGKDGDLRISLFVLFINYFVQFTYLYYYHFRDSQERFRQAVAIQERLRYEKITAQYKALQNHISPHFIFNSLGGIDRIIRERPADASRVIYTLSDCLQHILITLERDTITLKEELAFIAQYAHLLHIRFQENIVLNFRIDKGHSLKKIPPCLLQMLVENAVKHNRFDEAQPLRIRIESQVGDRLLVSNNRNRKTNQREILRTGTGLDNIKQRYQLLTDENIILSETDQEFSVSLPLLNA